LGETISLVKVRRINLPPHVVEAGRIDLPLHVEIPIFLASEGKLDGRIVVKL
jgi:hypothetical protein